MKAKILTTIDIKQEWLNEIKKHIPTIVFDIERTTTPIQVYKHPTNGVFYPNFNHMRSLFPTGNWRYRAYVMSNAERLAYGMKGHFAAYDASDRDGVLDFYMSDGESDRTKRLAELNGFKYNFARRFVHEALHGKEQEIGRVYLGNPPDRTHDWEEEGRLKELVTEHSPRETMLMKIPLLKTLVELWTTYNSLKKNLKQ